MSFHRSIQSVAVAGVAYEHPIPPHTHTHTHTHTHPPTHPLTLRTHTYTHMHTINCTYARARTHTHAHTHTQHALTHTRTHTHTHTRALMQRTHTQTRAHTSETYFALAGVTLTVEGPWTFENVSVSHDYYNFGTKPLLTFVSSGGNIVFNGTLLMMGCSDLQYINNAMFQEASNSRLGTGLVWMVSCAWYPPLDPRLPSPCTSKLRSPV